MVKLSDLSPEEVAALKREANRPKHEGVLVRLDPDLIKRLDRYRGGLTRPQAIRQLMTTEDRL